MPPGQQVYFN